MDSAPNAIEDIAYTWTAFGAVATFSFSSAETLAKKHASGVGAGGPVSIVVLRAFNIVLSLYTIVVFYITVVFCCILVYCLLASVHMVFEAFFRMDERTVGKPLVRKILYVVDNLADPGLVFAFVSKRMWKIHAAIFVAVMATVVLHSVVFISKRRLLSMGVDPRKPLPQSLVKTLFMESNSSVVSMLIALYITVFVREFALFLFAHSMKI